MPSKLIAFLGLIFILLVAIGIYYWFSSSGYQSAVDKLTNPSGSKEQSKEPVVEQGASERPKTSIITGEITKVIEEPKQTTAPEATSKTPETTTEITSKTSTSKESAKLPEDTSVKEQPAQPLPPAETTSTSTSLTNNVTVHFIYVNSGEAIFIDTNGKDLMVDAGCRSCGKTVSDYLNKISEKPEILMPSNHDEDHMGGLITLLKSLENVDVWDSGSSKSTIVYQDYITLANQKNLIIVERGQVYWLDDSTKVTILNPVQPLEFSKENDNSIVFKMEVGGISFFFAGDCEGPCEKSILQSGADVSANILKAGHHCSRTSTSEALLDAVNPKVAVCGVGTTGNSRYGHPHPEVLDRLEARNIATYTTLYLGDIKITADGNNFLVLNGS